MLTIICGEDIIAARTYCTDLKKSYQSQGIEVTELVVKSEQDINPANLGSRSLFAEKSVFFTANLNRLVSGLKDKAKLSTIKGYLADQQTEIIDWEQCKTARELKIAAFGQVKEFRPAETIFNLLDMCAPGNRRAFLQLSERLEGNQDEGFIYAMLCRHMRALIVTSTGGGHTISPWQRTKLMQQAKLWPADKLIAFYESLSRIDVSLKTGTNVYGIKKSLDILACYFL